MKCPACGFISFDDLEHCKKCQGDLADHKARFGLRSLLAPERRPRSSAPASPAAAPPGEPFNQASALDFPLRQETLSKEGIAEPETPLPLFAEEETGDLPDLRKAWENPLPGEPEIGSPTLVESQPPEFGERREEPPGPPGAAPELPFSGADEEAVVAEGLEPETLDRRAPEGPEPVVAELDRAGENPDAVRSERTVSLPTPRGAFPGALPGAAPAPPLALLAAGLLDLVLMGVVFGAFLAAGNLLVGSPGTLWPDAALLRRLAAPYFLIFFVLGFGYFTLLHYLTGQTLGKMVSRIRVESLEGSPPLLSQAFLRSVGGLLCWLLLGLGFVQVLAGRRGWNDRLASTRVVSVEDGHRLP